MGYIYNKFKNANHCFAGKLMRRFLTCLFLLLACSQAHAQFFSFYASTIIPVLSVSVTTCTAPCGVFVDLSGTTDPTTSYPFHERYYSTDFGDSGAGNWSYGSSNSVLSCGVGGQTTYCGFMPTMSRNIGIGPEVGHVYKNPGTYSIVTTVTGPLGSVKSAPVTVTVNDPATIYGGIWCANPSGACGGTGANCRFGGDASSPASSIGCTACVGAAFTNCPGGAGNDDPKSAGTTFTAIASNYLDASHSNRVLLHATESFVAGTAAIVIPASNFQIGSFDSGAQPIIQSTEAALGLHVLEIGPNTSNITFHDIQIDANSGLANQCTALEQNTKRYLSFNVTCTNASTLLGATTPVDSSAVVDEIYINSTSWHGLGDNPGNGGSCGAEVVFFRGVTRLSMLGNDIELADSRSQSMTRVQSWNMIEIGDSLYGRPCPTRSMIDIRGDTSPQAGGPVIYDKYANIHHNVAVANSEINGGGNPGIVNQPQSTPQDYGIQDLIFESNACWMGITSSNGCISTAEASNVTWRNNIVNGIIRAAGNTVMGYSMIWDSDTPYHPQPQNLWAYFNVRNCNTNNITGIGSGMFKFEEQYVPGKSFFKNNLDYCQSATNAPVVIDSGTSSSPVTAGNSDQVGGSATTNPNWSNGSGSFSLYSDYVVGLSTYKNAGTSNVPVFFDFASKSVPQTSPTIGVLQ